jgi:hypothetical protein
MFSLFFELPLKKRKKKKDQKKYTLVNNKVTVISLRVSPLGFKA